MGCTCANPKKRVQTHEQVSNRSISKSGESPQIAVDLRDCACGYDFTFRCKNIREGAGEERNQVRQEQEELWASYQNCFSNLQLLFNEHDIDGCMPLISTLQSFQTRIDYKKIDISHQQKQSIQQCIRNVKERHKDMLDSARHMQMEGWQDQGQKDGIKMYSRRQGGTIGILMQKEIDVSVQIFLFVMAEIELYDHLMPGIKECRNHKIGYSAYDLPIISIRQAIFEGVGYNRLKHNDKILVYSRSIHNRPDICAQLDYTPRSHKEYVQVDYNYMVVTYRPLAVGRGKASIALNVDMKIKFVPLFLLEFLSKQYCSNFFEVVVKASQNFKGSKWEEKIHKNPQTFQFFKDIIEEYYRVHNFK